MQNQKTELKEYDSVELIADKKRYAEHGVYKGMQGWICFAKEVLEAGPFINCAKAH